MPQLQIGRFDIGTQEKILKTFLLEEMANIISEQDSTGVIASGESAKKLRVETIRIVDGEVVRGELIDASASFVYQEAGRGPYNGGQAIVGGLWGKIYTWLRYKKYGLGWSTKKERINLAWRITKKIQRFGTYTHIQNIKTGVLSKSLSREKYDELRDKILTIENVTEIKDILTKGLFT